MTRLIRQNLIYSLGKVRKMSIAKQVKSLKQNLDSSGIEQPMISSRRGSVYDTIRPLENAYASIQIINNLGFDKGAEDYQPKILGDLDSESLYEKKDFIQKYINQTRKPILLLEEFPKSIYTSKTISEYNPNALKNIK